MCCIDIGIFKIHAVGDPNFLGFIAGKLGKVLRNVGENIRLEPRRSTEEANQIEADATTELQDGPVFPGVRDYEIYYSIVISNVAQSIDLVALHPIISN